MRTILLLIMLISSYNINAQCVNQGKNPEQDFDCDGVLNSYDLDDDNDGIMDIMGCPASQLNVLINTTNEDGFDMRTNLINEFTNNYLVPPDVVSYFNAEEELFNTRFYDGYDLVIIFANELAVHPTRWAFLTDAIKNRTSTSFIIMTEGWRGNGTTANPDGLISLLNDIYAESYGYTSIDSQEFNSIPNPSSTYINEMAYKFPTPLGTTRYITNVAAEDALGFKDGTTSTIEFMKQVPNSNNKSSYVYASMDASEFITSNYSSIENKIATPFYNILSAAKICRADVDNDGIVDSFDLDSDGDGCPDAIEANVKSALEEVALGSGIVVNGDGTTNTSISTAQSVVSETTFGTNGFADNLETSGNGIFTGTYTANNIRNSATNGCICMKNGASGIPDSTTKIIGISTLNRSKVTSTTTWPHDINNGFVVLESQDRGLVLTRIQDPTTDIATPKEGMIVYDINARCLKLYNGTSWGCLVQTCTDNH